MIGNSSSAIIEAPTFALPAVNVGDRQRGRLRAANVIDVDHDRQAIVAAIRRALEPGFRTRLAGLVNPYGDGHAAPRIARVLREVELGPRLTRKRFVDLPR
jgi:UDP-N-acetylglucosamine 2-epimerase